MLDSCTVFSEVVTIQKKGTTAISAQRQQQRIDHEPLRDAHAADAYATRALLPDVACRRQRFTVPWLAYLPAADVPEAHAVELRRRV